VHALLAAARVEIRRRYIVLDAPRPRDRGSFSQSLGEDRHDGALASSKKGTGVSAC
jgi:hypothetical protein